MDGLTVGQESKLITYAKTSPTIYQFMDSLSDRQMARVMNAILNSLTEEQVLKLVQHMILNLDADQMTKLAEFLNLKSEYRALCVSV
jgi:predicted transcriptional regulator